MKKTILGLIIIAMLIVGWYTLSPLLRNKELNEASPLAPNARVHDKFDSMDTQTRKEFDKQVQAMKNKDMIKAEPMPKQAQLLASGDLAPRAHEVQGRALLIKQDNKKILRFENLKTINGPDLRIYLATDLSDRDFVELAKIKATKGNVNYDVPTGVNTDRYNKVLIWCKAFSVLFSYAELK